MTDPITIDRITGYVKLADLDEQAAEFLTVRHASNGLYMAAFRGLRANGYDLSSAIGNLVLTHQTAFGVSVVLDDRAPVEPAPETKRSAK